MEIEAMLNEILTEVKSTKTELRQEFKKEIQEQVGVLRNEMHEQINGLRQEFKQEIQEQVGGLRNEMHGMFDKYNKEIANEINELAILMSKKTNKIYKEMRRQNTLNEKEHNLFKAEIDQLKANQKYLEAKIDAAIA